MPKIKRIRCANIQLEEGVKVIPDTIINFNSEHSILLLENGGGKTSIIHSILNNILGIKNFSGRDYKKTVAKNQVGHVLIEWELDGTTPKYMVSGLAFKNGNVLEGIKYYNYLFTYNDGDAVNLDTIELTKTDQATGKITSTGYQELKKDLRTIDNSGVCRINIFDRLSDYQINLENFGILIDEWRSIAQINGDESKAGDFFDKGKTTINLIKNVLIPDLLKAKNGGSTNELSKAFESHQANIEKLSEIEKNEKDYTFIPTKLKPIKVTFEKLSEAKNNLKNTNKSVLNQYGNFIIYLDDLNKKTKETQNKIKLIEEEIENINYKIDSFEFNEIKNEIEELTSKKEELTQKLNNETSIKDNLTQQKNQLTALFNYNIFLKKDSEIKASREQIENMSKEEPELRAKLEEKFEKVSNLALVYLKLIEEEHNTLKQTINSLKSDIENTENLNKDALIKISSLETEIKALNKWFVNFNNIKKSLESTFSLSMLEDPEKTSDSIKEQLTELKEKLENNILNLNSNKNKVQELKLSNKENEFKIKQLNISNISNKQFLSNYEDEKEKMKIEIFTITNELFYDISVESEDVLLKLSLKEKTVQENMNNKVSELDKLKKEYDFLNGKDFFSTNSNLEKLANKLNEKDVNVILGSQWLSELSIDEQEKSKYLNKYPYLPYVILYEEKEAKNIEKLLLKENNLNLEIPYLFVNKTKIDNNFTEENNLNVLKIWDKHISVFQPYDSTLFSSKEKLEIKKEELKNKIELVKSECELYSNEFKNTANLISNIKLFYVNYAQEKLTEVENKIKESSGDILTLNAEVLENENQIKELSEVNLNLEQENLSLKEQIKNNEFKVNSLINFIELFKNLSSNKDLKIKLETDLVESNKVKEQSAFDIKELKLKLETQQGYLLELLTEQKTFEEKIKAYSMSITEVEVSSENKSSVFAEFIENENSYLKLKEQLDRKQSNIKDIENIISLNEESKQLAEDEILKTGISFDYLKENLRPVNKDEIIRVETELEKSIEEVNKLKNKEIKLDSSIENSLKASEKEKNKIFKKFEKEPFIFESLDDLKLLEENLKELSKEKISLNEQISDDNKTISEIEDTIEQISEKFNTEPNSIEIEPISFEWFINNNDSFKKYWKTKSKEITKFENEISSIKNTINSDFQKLLTELKLKNNQNLNRLALNLNDLINSSEFFEPEITISKIDNHVLQIEQLIIQSKEQMKSLKETREEFIILCYEQILSIYESIIEMSKNSKIQLYGKDIKAFNINWDILDEESAKAKIENHIKQAIEHSKNLKIKGVSEDEIKKINGNKFQIETLVDLIAPISNCKVTVFKPSRESIIKNQIRYFNWDEASSWSGGEKYSIYMITFMLLIKYIRSMKIDSANGKLVVVADNPFGAASSPHVIQPFIEFANKNNIQIICLTAIKEHDVLSNFPVINSCKYYSTGLKEIMEIEEVDSSLEKINKLKTLSFVTL